MHDTAALLTLGRYRTSDAKTAHGLVRGPSRFRILAVLDGDTRGGDAGEELDGTRRGIPLVADLDALLAAGTRPDWLVVGVATSGGVLPDAMKPPLAHALEQGIHVASGLHDFVADDPELAAAAARGGARIVDIRRPRPRRELHFWTGAIRDVRAPRVAVLGTDCALGKRTTCQVLARACRERGLATEMVYTGQTGWLQGAPFGFVLDATPNDFVSGELEHAIVACDRALAPDLILLEGQSALRNPSGPCGAELLLSGGARGVILQHAPARHAFEDLEHLGLMIPSLTSELALIRMYGAEVLALALNHQGLAATAREATRAAIERETGLPAFFPLLEPADRALAPLLAHVARERAR